MRTSIPLVVLALTACRAVDPAPADLDGQLHWFWDNGFSADDDGVHETVAALRLAVEADVAEDPLRGSVSDLSDEQIVPFVDGPQVASESTGFYLVNAFDCSMEQLEPVLIARDQDAQYLDFYDRYERTYTTDDDAYLARAAPELLWDIDLTASILGATYTEQLSGGVRYVRESGEEPAVMVQRTWLVEPAVFEEGSNKAFVQDYQIEVYAEVSPGRMLHAYGLWRETELGTGLTDESDLVINTTLNNLEDWDERTSELCRGDE